MQLNPALCEVAVPDLNSDLTIIIPTLNEVASIPVLLRSLARELPGARALVVDDCSSDGTPAAVRLEAERLGSDIELFERAAGSIRGITASVLDAVWRVRTPWFVVMDGDLQHPVEIVPEIFRELRDGTDLVVAARESIAREFSRARAALSKAASTLASLRLSSRGVKVRDPLSGFFGARTDYFREALLEFPREGFELRGYKVLFDFLKALPRASKQNVKQVHYRFGIRRHGESKLGPRHVWFFLRSLLS